MTKHTIIEQMKTNATSHGYYLCPDPQLFNDLIEGLETNTKRYGYGSCPCRVASGVKKYDVDIICPCEYRAADIDEFGMCYCGLFVNEQIKNNPSQMKSVPERRPPELIDTAYTITETQHTALQENTNIKQDSKTATIKIWRCQVCGYLCAREQPPPLCPICKAKVEYFEPFTICEST